MQHPNLFIVGAPKCGTSAIASYLAAHKDVFLGHVKEPNFWSYDMPFFAKREGFLSKKDYFAMYKKAPRDTRYQLDASTHYLYSDVAIKAIMNEFQDPKFIVCIRPHIELATAWHMQMYNAGYETIPRFEEAWAMRVARRRGIGIPSECPESKLLDYENIAKVGGQLERMFVTVGERSRVHVVFLSDLKADPGAVYSECLRFLGLEEPAEMEFKVENPSFTNRSRFLSRFIREPRVRRPLNKLRAVIGPRWSKVLKQAATSLLYKEDSRRAIPPDLANELRVDFHEDNLKVKGLFSRSLYD